MIYLEHFLDGMHSITHNHENHVCYVSEPILFRNYKRPFLNAKYYDRLCLDKGLAGVTMDVRLLLIRGKLVNQLNREFRRLNITRYSMFSPACRVLRQHYEWQYASYKHSHFVFFTAGDPTLRYTYMHLTSHLTVSKTVQRFYVFNSQMDTLDLVKEIDLPI